MNKIEWVVASGVAAAAVGLVACTGEKPAMEAKPVASTLTAMPNPCTTPPAAVQVNVNQVNVSGTTATINVSPDKARIPASGGSVHWKFNANGYRLAAASAVTFKASQPAGPLSGSGDDSNYFWCFGSTAPTSTWAYNISFSPDNDLTKIYDCDPTIINSASNVPLDAPPVNCTLRR